VFSLRVCDHLAARDATGGANRLHREIQIVATTIYSELLYPCCPCYAWAGSGGFAIVAFARFHSTNPPNPRSLNLNFDRLIDCLLHVNVRVCMHACVRSAEHAHWSAGGERHNDCPAGSAGRRSRGRAVQALIAETKSLARLPIVLLPCWPRVESRSYPLAEFGGRGQNLMPPWCSRKGGVERGVPTLRPRVIKARVNACYRILHFT
jgi:hypothetical protein